MHVAAKNTDRVSQVRARGYGKVNELAVSFPDLFAKLEVDVLRAVVLGELYVRVERSAHTVANCWVVPHELDECVDVPSTVKSEEALFAIAGDVHAEVLLDGRTWRGVEVLIKVPLEIVNDGGGGLAVSYEKVVGVHDYDDKAFAGVKLDTGERSGVE